jgi:hypothetical protein
MKETPNYFAIIPAEVRYDASLKDKAKLLYGEITALSDKNGYCYASNKYFAELYNISITSISLLIKNLIENGYIESEIIYKENSKEIDKRYLRIVKGGYLSKIKDGIKENLKDNNIKNNNTRNNIYNKYGTYGRIKLTKEQYDRLIEEYGEDHIKKQIELLDEYIQSNNNKNKYTDFNLVIRKSIRNNWFNNKKENIVPSWFNKDIEKEEINKEDQEYLQELLKNYK